MKKKLLFFVLLFALVFSIGCSKESDDDDSPSKEVTSTPIPENLAKKQLDKLPAAFDSLQTGNQNTTLDTSKGIGCDITLDLSINPDLLSLFGITDLDKISVTGSYDIKEDAFAGDFTFLLNADKVITAQLIADSTNLFFNLPKYSSDYASASWEDLLESVDMDLDELTGIGTEALASGEELTAKLRSNIVSFVNCFKKVDGIEKDVTIGTGDYTLTGEKHTVKAAVTDLTAALEDLEDTLSDYAEVDLDTEDFFPEDASAFLLDYYVDGKDNYAWALYPDTDTDEPVIFINTDAGFCLYRVEDDDVSIAVNSVKTSKNSGTIYLPMGEDEEDSLGEIEYSRDGDNFHMEAELESDDADAIEFTLDASTAKDKQSYDLSMTVDDITIALKGDSSKDQAKISLSLLSLGVEYGTLDVTAKIRDYKPVSAPSNTWDLEDWVTQLDQTALVTDLQTLVEDYPFLIDLLGGSDDVFDPDNHPNDWSDKEFEDEEFVLPEDYTDEFMNMTGYTIDEDGYVDFEPLPEEVFAAGKPSTGLDTLNITEDQKKALFTIAENAFPSCETDSDAYYWIWGSTEYDDVRSFYTNDYEFDDPDNWDNSITLTFDAVSGEFSSVEIYYASKDEAFRIANEMFEILGGTYTLTTELVEEYTYDYDNGFAFSGYDAAQYGSNYYMIGIDIISSDWDW